MLKNVDFDWLAMHFPTVRKTGFSWACVDVVAFFTIINYCFLTLSNVGQTNSIQPTIIMNILYRLIENVIPFFQYLNLEEQLV